MSPEDRFIGYLLGVAIGNVLEMPFEGLPAPMSFLLDYWSFKIIGR
jgi:hypothetical protein